MLPLPDSGFYARTIHHTLDGEWDYDTDLKATPSPAIRVGWLRAVLQGHQRVAAGLGLPMPVLVMTSAKTDFARKWHEGLHAADTVLDVEQMARRATKLGRHVTIVRFTDGLHDTVIGHLARIHGLKVISRTSVMRFRGERESLKAIAEELGVAHIVEGSVQRAGSKLRVVA